jgi:hypothetical protein
VPLTAHDNEPGKFLSLDERIMPFKSKLKNSVYNPMKPDKCEMKFYVLAESKSSYVLNMRGKNVHWKKLPLILQNHMLIKIENFSGTIITIRSHFQKTKGQMYIYVLHS